MFSLCWVGMDPIQFGLTVKVCLVLVGEFTLSHSSQLLCKVSWVGISASGLLGRVYLVKLAGLG